MINKSNYIALKKYLKTWSKPQIEALCDDIKFNDSEKNIFLEWYDGESVVKIAMDNFESCRSYTNHVKLIFSKIKNYFDFININYQ